MLTRSLQIVALLAACMTLSACKLVATAAKDQPKSAGRQSHSKC